MHWEGLPTASLAGGSEVAAASIQCGQPLQGVHSSQTAVCVFFAQLPGQVKKPKTSGWLHSVMSHTAESLQSLLRLDSKIQRKLP